MAGRAFEVVQDEQRPDPGDPPSPANGGAPNPPTKAAQAAMIAGLLLALKAISQRAFVALLDTFSLITSAAVFWLFYSFENPTVYQIVHASIFAMFVLSINWVVRQPR